MVDASVTLAAAATDVGIVLPVVGERGANRCRHEITDSAPAVILYCNHYVLLVAKQNRNRHPVAIAATIGYALRFSPCLSTIEAATERYLLFACCHVRALVGKIKLEFTAWQFEEGRFPATVFESVVGIIDKYFFAPCLTVIGASAQADAKASVLGIRL